MEAGLGPLTYFISFFFGGKRRAETRAAEGSA